MSTSVGEHPVQKPCLLQQVSNLVSLSDALGFKPCPSNMIQQFSNLVSLGNALGFKPCLTKLLWYQKFWTLCHSRDTNYSSIHQGNALNAYQQVKSKVARVPTYSPNIPFLVMWAYPQSRQHTRLLCVPHTQHESVPLLALCLICRHLEWMIQTKNK